MFGDDSLKRKSVKMYVVGTHLNGLCEASLTSGHNILFFQEEELQKINTELLSQNYHQKLFLNYSSAVSASAPVM